MISPYSLTVPGGVQHQILGLARALRAGGVEVRVLAPCDGPPPEAWVTPLGSSLPTATNGSIAPLAPDPSAQLRVIRALRDEAFDVLHLHEPLAPGPTITAAVMKPAPMVATYHRAGDSRAYRYLNRLARWVAGRIEVNVAVSEDAEATARAALGGSYEILYNGVETNRFSSGSPRADTPTLLFIGRHEPRKGLDVLLAAMELLPAEVRLWVAGDGADTAAMRRGTAGDQRIEWLGRIDESEKASRLQQASVFCAPSLSGESFGIVLIEAMAAGTPVVASDLPGYSLVARGGRDALLVPPGDPCALADALAAALSSADTELRVRSGLERAEMFSMSSLAHRYADLYEKAAHVTPVAPLARPGSRRSPPER